MKEERRYNIDLILILFPLMIITGKVIRWTILKNVLVDMSIGNGMIERIINGMTTFTSLTETGISDAAGNASAFFGIINIFNLSTTIEFEIYISIIWNLILIMIIYRSKVSLNTMQMIFLTASIAVLNIWDFCLAKEPVQLLFFLAIYYVIISRKIDIKTKYVLSILVMLISVLYYRVYYILIVAFMMIVAFLCNNWLLKIKKIRKRDVVILLVTLVISYFIMLNVIKVLDTNSYNELIRVRTREGPANTQMVNIFKSSNLILFCIDYLIMIIRMLFPIELITMGVKYWPYVFYQFIISYFIIKDITNMKNNTKSQNLALYIYIAFILGSATFEPDFGSWVRHEAATFPILMIVTKIVQMEEKIEQEYERNGNKDYKENNVLWNKKRKNFKVKRQNI